MIRDRVAGLTQNHSKVKENGFGKPNFRACGAKKPSSLRLLVLLEYRPRPSTPVALPGSGHRPGDCRTVDERHHKGISVGHCRATVGLLDCRTVGKLSDTVGHNCRTVGPGLKPHKPVWLKRTFSLEAGEISFIYFSLIFPGIWGYFSKF